MSRKKGNKNGQQASNADQEPGLNAPASGEMATTIEQNLAETAGGTEPETTGTHETDSATEPDTPAAEDRVDAITQEQPQLVESLPEEQRNDRSEISNGDVAAPLMSDDTEPDGELSPADDASVDESAATATADAGPSEQADKEITTEHVVEAILFTAETPLSPQKLVSILGTSSVREIRKIVQTLNKTYARSGHAFRIEEIAGGYQLLTLPEYNTWLRRLKQSRQESKLSPAAMETLAVVAYKQPVVRVEIEAIRGVSAGEMLNRLRELGLVKIVGRAEDVGRPMLYGTTRRFLEVFGLSSLEDLPAVEELQPPAG